MKGVYRIGDYYDDGVKRGVVIDVSEDGLHGKILSLEQRCCCWAEGLEAVRSEIGSYNKSDGVVNQAVAMQQENWQERYPAFAFCTSLGEGWYLPTIKELEVLIGSSVSVLNVVNQQLEQLHVLIVKGEYWSSTECGYFPYDDEYLVAMALIEDFKHPWNNTCRETYKGGAGYVRAVARF